MTDDQLKAITEFFDIATKLEELEVIRSSRYLGDIGEFLCKEKFDIDLEEGLRSEGHDATDENGRIQIKFSNSVKGNNINVGVPTKYERLIIVVGPNSKLKESDHSANEFRLYSFPSSVVKTWKSPSGNYYCAKTKLKKCTDKSSLTRP
ncbi:DUF6998 domain-containing protein [Vibrio campbellii]|uniref:DUF6998 domain-containing protein n=1 Tax=Vibrio campbellii TaxID=680 RepID=UPI003D6A6468